MNKYAITGFVVLILLGGALMWNITPQERGSGDGLIDINLLPISLPTLSLNLPFGEDITREEAWHTFEQYMEAARNHDLDTLRTHSYQLSPTCLDETLFEECKGLMDSVVFFFGELEVDIFSMVEADERQLALYTEYVDGARTVLYFVRTDLSGVKLLGGRFCAEGEGILAECFDNRDISTQDSDGDGWWDSTENSFR